MKLTDKFCEYETLQLNSLNIPLLYILEAGHNPNITLVVPEKIIKLLLL